MTSHPSDTGIVSAPSSIWSGNRLLATEAHDLQRVTIVVVLFNSRHCLPKLADLLKLCPHAILVDNGSHDGGAQAARELLPHAVVIEATENLGFGAANNLALAQVHTPFAFLLNPDCELDSAGLCAMLQAADRWPDAAILAPQLLDAHQQPEDNYRWPSTYWPPKGPLAQEDCCVGFLCGAALLIRMSRTQDLGFFDPRYFLYYEDDDLCLRLFVAKRPLMLIPSVHALHRSRGSVGRTARWRSEYGRGYHHAQSKLTFCALHRDLASAQRLRRKTLLLTTVALPFRLIAFSPRLIVRMLGRWNGLWKWTSAHLRNPRITRAD